ncbi:hypothetical protein M3J09_004971 [Ascochyta lentis]
MLTLKSALIQLCHCANGTCMDHSNLLKRGSHNPESIFVRSSFVIVMLYPATKSTNCPSTWTTIIHHISSPPISTYAPSNSLVNLFSPVLSFSEHASHPSSQTPHPHSDNHPPARIYSDIDTSALLATIRFAS